MKTEINPSYIGILQLYSYYALDSLSQVHFIGKGEPWFIKENGQDGYPKNYLIGLVISFQECFNYLEYDNDTLLLANKLLYFLTDQLRHGDGSFFTKEAILHNNDWVWIRETASKILYLLDYYPVNIKKPLDIYNFIEPYDYIVKLNKKWR